MKSFRLNPVVYFLWPEISVPMIRVGPKEDGGYLMPSELIPDIKNLISFGVNVDWRFERHINRLTGIPVNAYDCSNILILTTRFWLAGFYKFAKNRIKFIEVINRSKKLLDYFIFFTFKKNIFLHKLSINNLSVESIFLESPEKTMLKCDIEGGEYSIFQQIIKNKDKFDIIAFELHNVKKNIENLKYFFENINNDFVVIHMHMNNFDQYVKDGIPNIVEVTLVKRILLSKKDTKPLFLPIKSLDFKSVSTLPDFEILSPE